MNRRKDHVSFTSVFICNMQILEPVDVHWKLASVLINHFNKSEKLAVTR